nr:tetratricopeptide repeat protein [Lichenibacterium minor]
MALQRAGRLSEAEAAYRALLAQDPRDADALHLLGLARQQSGDAREGEAFIRGAIAIRDAAVFHLNLGTLLLAGRREGEAEGEYRCALALDPAMVDAARRLGALLIGAGRPGEVEGALTPTFAAHPHDADVLTMVAVARMRTGDNAGAEAAFRSAIAAQPRPGNLRYNLGTLLDRQKRSGEAEAEFRAAIALTPEHVEAHFNLGNLLMKSDRLDEARSCFEAALRLRPDYADARFNLGLLQVEQDQTDAAEASFRTVLSAAPDRPDARLALGTLLLRRGDYANGWPLYEARSEGELRENFNLLPDVPYPRWRGEDLTGKSLLLWPEQGYGDAIQFARFARELKRRGLARLTLGCHAPLAPLFVGLDGVDEVVTSGMAIAAHDYWSLPLSLPLHLGMRLHSVPAVLPYLRASPALVERWRPRAASKGFRVGLAWRGAAIHGNDARRSLPSLDALRPLWRVPGVEFVALQKGEGEEEARAAAAEGRLADLGSDCVDFADTAAVVHHLDLVIAVDTAVAHLTGAMGKPCWILLPAQQTDWRWLERRVDSPWYPNVVRLFRQAQGQGWAPTVDAVATALHALDRRRVRRLP